MPTKPEKDHLNQLLWDGKSLQDISRMFGKSEEDIVEILQPKPLTMKQATARDLFFPGSTKECSQDYGFSKREMILSIEQLPNKVNQMEKNGYWLDVFQWDTLNSRYLRARKDRNRDNLPLSDDAISELMEVYSNIHSRMNKDIKTTVNSDGMSKEDYLQKLILDCIERGRYGTEKAINHQINRSFNIGV